MFILVRKSSFFIFDCFLLLCYGLLSGLLLSLNNNDNNNNKITIIIMMMMMMMMMMIMMMMIIIIIIIIVIIPVIHGSSGLLSFTPVLKRSRVL